MDENFSRTWPHCALGVISLCCLVTVIFLLRQFSIMRTFPITSFTCNTQQKSWQKPPPFHLPSSKWSRKLNPLWNETNFIYAPFLSLFWNFITLEQLGCREVYKVNMDKEVSQFRSHLTSCWSIACRAGPTKCLARTYANDVIILILPLCIFWLLAMWYVTVLFLFYDDGSSNVMSFMRVFRLDRISLCLVDLSFVLHPGYGWCWLTGRHNILIWTVECMWMHWTW